MSSTESLPDAEVAKPAESSLLEWLEGFTEQLTNRTNAVADEVQQLVEEIGVVELNLKITFNSFRLLSSSQFVENHVQEEDETDLVTGESSKKDADEASMPIEDYEDEILPRYREAAQIAWVALRGGNRKDDQSSMQAGSKSKQRDSLHYERIQLLPHIIGSEEFMRDDHCGIGGLTGLHPDPEYDTDVERDKATVTAEPIVTGIVSEGEISVAQNDTFDSQGEGIEPAVSAALDFKAMLEAALRNPSLQYDGSTAKDSVFAEFENNILLLPDLTTKDSKNSPSSLAGPYSQWWTSLDDPTIEELSRKPSSTLTQPVFDEDFKKYMDGNIGNNQIGIDSLSHVPFVPGGLFDEDLDETAFLTTGKALEPDTNIGPIIPDGLFQEQPSLDLVKHIGGASGSSNPLNPSEILPPPLPSVVGIVTTSSHQESDTFFRHHERTGSDQTLLTSSLLAKRAIMHSSSLSISSGSNVVLVSHQAGQIPICGGLFDEEEDDDEDEAGNLFGASAPQVRSQPVLLSWASENSEGLFDNFETLHKGTTWISKEAGSRRELLSNNDIFKSTTPQYKSQSEYGAVDLRKHPVDSAEVKTTLGGVKSELVMSLDTKEVVSDNQIVVKENVQIPFQFNEAPAVRSSVFFIGSDDDSWSSSESGVGETSRETILMERKSCKDSVMVLPETRDSGGDLLQDRKAEGTQDITPEIPVNSEQVALIYSSQGSPLAIAIDRVEGSVGPSSQTPLEVPPFCFPSAITRLIPSTETSQAKVSLKLAESLLLQSNRTELSDDGAGNSSDSDSNSIDLQGIEQHRKGQNICVSPTISENLLSSTSQPISFVSQTSAKSLPSQDGSEMTSKKLPTLVNDLGCSSTRTITLFKHDQEVEAEEDLFGREVIQQKDTLSSRARQPDNVFSSDTNIPIKSEQGMIVDSESSLMTEAIHLRVLPASNPHDISFFARFTSLDNKNDNLTSAKAGTKSSTLLFGNDDEDDEVPLFGSLSG